MYKYTIYTQYIIYTYSIYFLSKNYTDMTVKTYQPAIKHCLIM